MYIKHGRSSRGTSSYFYSIRCLCAGLRGGSKANQQTVLRDVEALRVKGVIN